MLLVGKSVSCSCRLASLSDGKLVSTVQFIRSGLCSSTMLVEGTIQEKLSWLLEPERFNCGAGVVCETQMPPFGLATATSSLPSEEDATAVQYSDGRLFEVQLAPKFVELYRPKEIPLVL